jgi:hypothetical protein
VSSPGVPGFDLSVADAVCDGAEFPCGISSPPAPAPNARERCARALPADAPGPRTPVRRRRPSLARPAPPLIFYKVLMKRTAVVSQGHGPYHSRIEPRIQPCAKRGGRWYARHGNRAARVYWKDDPAPARAGRFRRGRLNSRNCVALGMLSRPIMIFATTVRRVGIAIGGVTRQLSCVNSRTHRALPSRNRVVWCGFIA